MKRAARLTGQYTDGGLRGRQERAGRPRRTRTPTSGAAPTSCGRSEEPSAEILCGEDRRLREGRHGRLPGHHDPRLGRCSRSPRSGSTPPASIPNCSRTPTVLKARGIPPATGLDQPRRAQHPQRRGRGHRTTGPARSSPTPAPRELHRQGQQEVPAPVRRPRRRLAPARFVDQAARLPHRHRRQDDDRGHDVHGRRDRLRAGGLPPTQADELERGPVRLRALQFSLNIPAIKAASSTASITVRADEDFGLDLPSTADPGPLDGHRDARDPPDRHGQRLRRDRQRRRADAAPDDHPRGPDEDGQQVWPPRGSPRAARRSKPRRPTSSPTSWPATRSQTSTPTGASGRSTSGRRRPAAYKTGTTSDNRDVHAYGYLARRRQGRPGARGRRLDGQQRQRARTRGSLARLVGAALVGDHAEVTKDMPIAKFKRPRRHRDGDRRRVHRPPARAVHDEDGQGAVHRGHGPDRARDLRIAVEIDEASGLLWHDGCVGPMVTKGFFDLSEVESQLPELAEGEPELGGAGGQGPGVRGGPKGTRTSYFYNNAFAPFGARGGAVRAARTNAPAGRPAAGGVRPDPIRTRPTRPPTPSPTRAPRHARRRRRRAGPPPTRRRAGHAQNPDRRAGTTRAAAGLRGARRSSPRRRPRLVRRVAPTHQRMAAPRRRTASRRAPGPQAVDDRHRAEARQRGVLEVAIQRLEGLLDPGTPQVERRGHRPRPRRVAARRRRRAPAPPLPVAAPAPTAAGTEAGTRSSRRRRRRASRPPRASPARPPLLDGGDPALPAARAAARPVADPPRASDAGSATGWRRLERRQAAGDRLGPGDAASRRRGRDRLALERRRVAASSSRRSATTRPASSRAARTASSRSRARAALLLGHPQASAARASAARASSASLVSPSASRIAASVASNERCASVRRERASVDDRLGQAEALGDRERLAAARQADGQPVGRRQRVEVELDRGVAGTGRRVGVRLQLGVVGRRRDDAPRPG